jgi:hypothetical protein
MDTPTLGYGAAHQNQRRESPQSKATSGQDQASPREGDLNYASSSRIYLPPLVEDRQLDHAQSRTGDRTGYGEFGDFLRADHDISRAEDSARYIDHRPVNQPLQVQPPREEAAKEVVEFNIGSNRGKDSHLAEVASPRGEEFKGIPREHNRTVSPPAHAQDDALDTDDEEYVVVREEEAAEAHDTTDFGIVSVATEMSS